MLTGASPAGADPVRPANAAAAPARVLVFTRTTGWRHDSIPVAVATLRELAQDQGLEVVHSEDPASFTSRNLAGFRAVLFASTTGDVLDEGQQAAMEAFVRDGGGFMGVHAAADTEYDWPWYGELVGARFAGHPPGLQTSRVRVAERHAIDADRGGWQVTDEFYNFRDDPRPQVEVLATLTGSDFVGGTMGDDHPIAWCRGFDGGRSWYTGLGHDVRVWSDPVFRRHLARGLRYATGAADAC